MVVERPGKPVSEVPSINEGSRDKLSEYYLFDVMILLEDGSHCNLDEYNADMKEGL